MIDIGDLVHATYPDLGPDTPVSKAPYISRASGKPAVGVVVDMLENEDGFYHYQVLIEGELMWWPDIQLKLVDDTD